MSAGIKFHKVHKLFDSSAAHQLPHVNGPKVQEILGEINFKVPFHPDFELNQDYDIPYLCGYDAQDDIVYFDKDFSPASYSEGDATPTLMTHEEVEKLIEPSGLDYQQRHHIATHCESLAVADLGWDWQSYTRWTTHSWHESYAKWKGNTSGLRVPATLDMSPYIDEDDQLVKAMRKAGAQDSGEEG